MEKQQSKAFGKNVFLLGADEEGTWYWLEEQGWDCDWYWGFGYIETYTNNQHPEKSKDISSHQHAEDFMSKWFKEWNGSKPILKDKTFSEAEGWELSELFAQFYHLQEQAEFWGRGKMNTANTTIKNWQDKSLAEKINKIILPVIMNRIIEILTPKEAKE